MNTFSCKEEIEFEEMSLQKNHIKNQISFNMIKAIVTQQSYSFILLYYNKKQLGKKNHYKIKVTVTQQSFNTTFTVSEIQIYGKLIKRRKLSTMVREKAKLEE